MLLPDDSPFWRWQADYRPGAFLLALSGGRDSMALLQALTMQRARLTAPLVACYVNHGWSAASADWGAFCQREAAARGVACEIVKLDWPEGGGNAEARARALRYQALATRLPPRGVLLTAHHRDDQAETFLLQALRGSGLDGLAAMPARRAFAAGELWRPLLDVPRAAVEAFIAAEGVAYLDDPSNADPHYARNRLRLSALPALRDGFPQADAALARSAAWLGEALAVQQGLLDGILGDAATVLPWQALMERFDAATCKALLRRWLQRAGQPAPPAARLLSFVEALAGQGQAQLRYGATVVVQYRGDLHLFQACEPQAPPPWLRRRLPLLVADGECAWLGGFGAAAGWQGLAFDWHNQAHFVKIPHLFDNGSDRLA